MTDKTKWVAPTQPKFNKVNNVLQIPYCKGVRYFVNGIETTWGCVLNIIRDTTVTCKPKSGYNFPYNIDKRWEYPGRPNTDPPYSYTYPIRRVYNLNKEKTDEEIPGTTAR